MPQWRGMRLPASVAPLPARPDLNWRPPGRTPARDPDRGSSQATEACPSHSGLNAALSFAMARDFNRGPRCQAVSHGTFEPALPVLPDAAKARGLLMWRTNHEESSDELGGSWRSVGRIPALGGERRRVCPRSVPGRLRRTAWSRGGASARRGAACCCPEGCSTAGGGTPGRLRSGPLPGRLRRTAWWRRRSLRRRKAVPRLPSPGQGRRGRAHAAALG
jgi:hypothetical protein